MKRFFIEGTIILMVLCAAARASGWVSAEPGWIYEFPRDHSAHPDFKTEWWYFTGNLVSNDGREFGYQLTFFRQGVQRGAEARTRFAVEDIKLAHFAVSDLSEGKFHHAQKVSRGAFGEAGFSDGERLAWIGDWEARLAGPGHFRIRAKDGSAALALDLVARKPPVIHGKEGVSQKSEGRGRASHYYSFPRLEASGTIELGGETIPVEGWSWFDQEWATNQLTEEQTGWDWLSLQFDDGTELMLFQIRLKGGGRDRFSHGTWIDAQGKATHIANEDFELSAGRVWRSPDTGAGYPVDWKLRVPKLQLDVEVRAAMDEQELVLRPIAYWEGSVRAEGSRGTDKIAARGYLEMTGYAGGLIGLQAPGTR